MAQCPDNLDDSDETFYCPDTDKDPSEVRFLSENDDDFYEREYNKYGPGGLGPRLSYCEPDSEQTFFEHAEDALRPDALPDLPDTEETYYEPAEYANRQPEPPSDGTGTSAPTDADALGVIQVQDCLNQNMFMHDLQWSPTCSQFVQGEAPGGAPSPSTHDLYVEMPDPLTQEVRVYRVPCLDADTLRLLTQDLLWTQDQAPVADEVGAGWCGARGLVPDPTQGLPDWAERAGEGLDHGLGANQRNEAPVAPASDTARLLSQDLDWTQTQFAGMDMELPKHEVTAGLDPTSSSGHSMDVGSASPHAGQGLSLGLGHGLGEGNEEVGQQPAPQPLPVGSSDSSEGLPLQSVPSFDDDLGQPLAPQWPMLPEEQFKMEEILTSLRCMSFNLDLSGSGDDPLGLRDCPEGRDGARPSASPPPQRPPPPPPPASQSRSPSFTTVRRRRRRGRPRGSATPRPDASQIAVAQHDKKDGVSTGFKRKRSGGLTLSRSGSFAGQGSQPQSQLRGQGGQGCHPVPVCSPSPSSPPRRKARRTFGPEPGPQSSRVGRADMVAVYSQLREMRYLMQDIIRGREPLPIPQEVEKMQREVQVMISKMDEAEQGSRNLTNKTRMKRQEARQVADKLLDQLRVISECHESQSHEQLMPDGSFPSTSGYNTTVENPLQSLSLDSNVELKYCPPQQKKFENPATAHKDNKENYHRKQFKEKKQKSTKRTNDKIKNANLIKHESQEKNQGKTKEQVYHDNATVWQSCIKSKNDNETDDAGQFGAVIVGETEEAQDEIVTDTCIEIPQTQLFSDDLHSHTVCNEGKKAIVIFPSATPDAMIAATSSSQVEPQEEGDEDPAAQEEYQYIVKLIKSKAATNLTRKTSSNNKIVEDNDSVFTSGPLMLTGILLPKRSELEPILDFPEEFWGNPHAPIPEEWINMLEWED